MRTLRPSLVIKTKTIMSRIHYLVSGMRYRIILLGEAQHLENGEEIEIGRITPLDVQGIQRTSSMRQQQQQPPASPGSPPASPPSQLSSLRRRRVHPYRDAILPVPRPVTPPTSSGPAILPVRHTRPTARMSTSRLSRILRDFPRD